MSIQFSPQSFRATSEAWLAAPMERFARGAVSAVAGALGTAVAAPSAAEMLGTQPYTSPWYTLVLDVVGTDLVNVLINGTLAYRTPAGGGLFEIPQVLTTGQAITIQSTVAGDITVNVSQAIPRLEMF